MRTDPEPAVPLVRHSTPCSAGAALPLQHASFASRSQPHVALVTEGSSSTSSFAGALDAWVRMRHTLAALAGTVGGYASAAYASSTAGTQPAAQLTPARRLARFRWTCIAALARPGSVSVAQLARELPLGSCSHCQGVHYPC
jgi:hypothetical protein